MSGGTSRKPVSPWAELFTSAAIGAVLAAPCIFVLVPLRQPAGTAAGGEWLWPPGYTCSLTLFLVPAGVLAAWFFRRSAASKRVFFQSLGLLVLIGLVLDFLFGPQFFAWPNRNAVVGIMVPALGGSLPAEEVVFYVSGFAFLLLTYIWCDESWLASYQRHSDGKVTGKVSTRWCIGVGLTSLAVLLGAVVCKKLSSTPAGFPGYLTYVLLVAIGPPFCCLPSVVGSVNWRAFSFTQLAMALICVVWEVTLALPQQWWSFHPEMMTGVYIPAWSNLPVEEPLVWLASPFTVVVTYEFVKQRRAMGMDERPADAARVIAPVGNLSKVSEVLSSTGPENEPS